MTFDLVQQQPNAPLSKNQKKKMKKKLKKQLQQSQEQSPSQHGQWAAV